MTGLACLGALSLIAGVMVIYPIVSGWALVHLWRWFIAPVFGVGELNIAQAIGIAMVASYLTYHDVAVKDNRDKSEQYVAIVLLFLRPVVVVMTGWVVHQFI